MPLYCFHIPPTTLNPSHFHQKSHKILGTHNEKRVLASRKISHAAHSRISPLWTVDEIAEAKMANYARNKFHGCLVGVTGSAGKTTTRTMIALTLESLGLVHQTHGNENNRIGVCLSLIGIPQNVGFVVLELGMDRRGEIMELARMARPSIRVILNVGRRLQWQREILAEAKPGMCVLFGQRLDCDVRFAAEKVHGGHGVRVVLERNHEKVEFVIPSPGLHLAQNACATAAVAVALGFLFLKLEYHCRDLFLKRVAILGDMLELGQAETVSHEMMLSLCCDSHFDLIALVGKRFLRAAENLNLVGERNLLYSPDAESLAFEIVQRLNRNDVILVKGSRGMQMEKVVAAIKAMNLGFPHE
ncbi:hypothetical protein AAG906_025652 [Vitis piasezkii]